jgi:ketosteroid isomerase-like protein
MHGNHEAEHSMNDIAVVKRVVDGILAQDLEPVLDLLAEDVVFKVAIPGEMPICFEDAGKQAMTDYFRALGGIVTFWKLEFFAQGEHVVALGNESYIIGNRRVMARSDFALVCDVRDGLITRFLVVEDLWSFLQDGSPLIELEDRLQAASGRRQWSTRGEAALVPA